MNQKRVSLIEILRWRAINQAYKLCYRFLIDGENIEELVTYYDLDIKARAIGAWLQSQTSIGDRVLLLLPTDLHFISAYFGCLYAKSIAVPMVPPHPARLEKSIETIFRMIADAQPTAVIINSSLLIALDSKIQLKEKFGSIKFLVADQLNIKKWAKLWQKPVIESNDIAHLQYTSGSTSKPKGVMVSHGNLMHNLKLIEESCKLTQDSCSVSWLPPYHDMGLICGFLAPLYTGFEVSFIPHLLFLQKPLRWLKAISKYKATVSGAPNFAYELCLSKIKPEQKSQINLSNWVIAFNGAEQVNSNTLENFTKYFSSCGFQTNAFFPCYGLAEATILVSGGPKELKPKKIKLLRSALNKNLIIQSKENDINTKILISCGINMAGQNIQIVNPNSLIPCCSNEVGEIWINSPSVTLGYWNNPLATMNVFKAKIKNYEDIDFLRTGDLGFIYGGELFIVGRIKNLIILDGKNHYPQDIENTVVESHHAIRPSGCAVFSIEGSNTERVVVLIEVKRNRTLDKEEVKKAIRRSVADKHEIRVFDIKIVLPGSIPKTTSGKTKHFLCKKFYLNNQLKEIAIQ